MMGQHCQHLLLAKTLAQQLLQLRAALAAAAGIDEHQDWALWRAADLLVGRHALAIVYLRHGILQKPHWDAAGTMESVKRTAR